MFEIYLKTKNYFPMMSISSGHNISKIPQPPFMSIRGKVFLNKSYKFGYFNLGDFMNKCIFDNFRKKTKMIKVRQSCMCPTKHYIFAEVLRKFFGMSCTFWYHLYNLKNVENTHGGVLLSVKLYAFSLVLQRITLINIKNIDFVIYYFMKTKTGVIIWNGLSIL